MSDRLEIEVHATHLYPGAKGRVRGVLAPEGARQSALVLFSDQATAEAKFWAQSRGDFLLAVGPHRTARGTDIVAKTWRLSLEGESRDCRFRVAGREK